MVNIHEGMYTSGKRGRGTRSVDGCTQWMDRSGNQDVREKEVDQGTTVREGGEESVQVIKKEDGENVEWKGGRKKLTRQTAKHLHADERLELVEVFGHHHTSTLDIPQLQQGIQHVVAGAEDLLVARDPLEPTLEPLRRSWGVSGGSALLQIVERFLARAAEAAGVAEPPAVPGVKWVALDPPPAPGVEEVAQRRGGLGDKFWELKELHGIVAAVFAGVDGLGGSRTRLWRQGVEVGGRAGVTPRGSVRDGSVRRRLRHVTSAGHPRVIPGLPVGILVGNLTRGFEYPWPRVSTDPSRDFYKMFLTPGGEAERGATAEVLLSTDFIPVSACIEPASEASFRAVSVVVGLLVSVIAGNKAQLEETSPMVKGKDIRVRKEPDPAAAFDNIKFLSSLVGKGLDVVVAGGVRIERRYAGLTRKGAAFRWRGIGGSGLVLGHGKEECGGGGGGGPSPSPMSSASKPKISTRRARLFLGLVSRHCRAKRHCQYVGEQVEQPCRLQHGEMPPMWLFEEVYQGLAPDNNDEPIDDLDVMPPLEGELELATSATTSAMAEDDEPIDYLDMPPLEGELPEYVA
ncbi:hypothetical protein B0H16DRAFT_1460918 [Mycena metata]|uniref:Uncharacterized protein n=1 Tax=Mycena metata TaxID=1033252 RepID=A0AAD7IT79_9AGAR|nr:hypothetical protein B0H16DRAFT_1460918 [Mycena metata]